MRESLSCELCSCSELLEHQSIEEKQVNCLYDQFDPLLRLCIDYLLEPAETKEYEDDVRRAVSDITSQPPEELLDESGALEIDDLPQNLSHQSRESGRRD